MKTLAFVAAALLASTAAVPAVAKPITYNFSGNFVGTRAGNAFQVFATFRGTGDTANAHSQFGNAAVTAVDFTSLSADTSENQTFTVTSPAFFAFYGPGQYGNAVSRVGIGFDTSGVNAIGLESAAFDGYDGLSTFPLTPATTYFDNATFQTNGGQVVITSFTGGSFSATAVPEPATWGMMMLGFGMVGYGLRRRSKNNVTTKVSFA